VTPHVVRLTLGGAGLSRLRWPGLDQWIAFAVGEQAVATGARRHLVNERGVPKKNVTFCGYWRRGQAHRAGRRQMPTKDGIRGTAMRPREAPGVGRCAGLPGRKR
jgi:NADPH-dependent ferric siderophore reductase